MVPNRVTSPDLATVTAADELFLMLDGMLVTGRDESWRVEICGIHTGRDRHWIQVNLIGAESYGVTIATDQLSADAIRQQLHAWIEQPPSASPLLAFARDAGDVQSFVRSVVSPRT